MDQPHSEEWLKPSEEWLKHRKFGIVIDAGSSGSRIHIYSWINKDHIHQSTPQRDYIGVLPTIEPGVESGTEHSGEWTKKTEPGTEKQTIPWNDESISHFDSSTTVLILRPFLFKRHCRIQG